MEIVIVKWVFNTAPPFKTNFEIQKYYENQLRFNGVYSRDNLSKIKDGAYIIILISILILELNGLLCMCKIIITMLFTSILLV